MSIAPVSPTDRLCTLPPGEPPLTLGFEAFDWMVRNLIQPNGPRAGQPFKPTFNQCRFLLWWYAVDEDGRWLFNHGVRRLAKGSGKSPFAAAESLAEFCGPVRLLDFDAKAPGGCRGRPVDMPLVQIAATAESQTANTMRMVRAFAPKSSELAARYQLDVGKTRYYRLPEGTLEVITSSPTAAEGGEGSFIVADEALSLGTMIPTPDGWTTVERIEVGDRLFGSDGIVTVTHVTPVFIGRPCCKVTFEDKTAVVVDEGHLWQSELVSSAAQPKVRTTREMSADGRRFKVPKMRPFDAVDLDLPIHPYVLGAWLGDGSSRWASLTVGAGDLDFMLAAVRERGVPAAKVVKSGADRAPTVSLQGNASGHRYTKDGSSFRGGLVKLGVLGDKHIPAPLLRASLAQRLALLQGLMDTDGSIDSKGSAVFVGSRKRLVDGVAELVRSLGYSANVTSRTDRRWPSDPIVYKVSFRPDKTLCPFLLPRKASRVRPPSRRLWKTIRSIEPTASVPVKCIEVDSDDHLFVAGEGWTLTHNTEHWKPANGGVELAATLADNLAKSGSRMMETSNAWVPGADSVAENTWEAWLAQEEGRTRGKTRILYDATVAPADTNLRDPDSLRRALEHVYADCPWVDIVNITERILSLRAREDDSRRKYLNRPTAAHDSWVAPEEWGALPHREAPPAKSPIVMFFDGSKSKDATALVGCEMESGDVFTLGVWEPDPNDDASTVDAEDVDRVVINAFETFDVLAFFADVREWESFVLTTWPQRYKDDLLVWAVPTGKPPQSIAWDMRSHSAEFARAAEACHAEIVDKEFGHDGDSRVARHVGNARRRPYQAWVSIGKESPDSPRKIDAAICVIGVRMVRRLVLNSGKQRKKRSGRAVFV